MADQKRILIADDDPELLELLKTALGYQNYLISEANDGRQALQTALSERFDLVVLDVMMPYIDGYHVAHQISDKLGEKCPPILIMSSRDVQREKGIALMSGAEAILQKPFEITAFQAKVAEILNRPQAQ